jgi:hypothetical protein
VGYVFFNAPFFANFHVVLADPTSAAFVFLVTTAYRKQLLHRIISHRRTARKETTKSVNRLQEFLSLPRS